MVVIELIFMFIIWGAIGELIATLAAMVVDVWGGSNRQADVFDKVFCITFPPAFLLSLYFDLKRERKIYKQINKEAIGKLSFTEAKEVFKLAPERYYIRFGDVVWKKDSCFRSAENCFVKMTDKGYCYPLGIKNFIDFKRFEAYIKRVLKDEKNFNEKQKRIQEEQYNAKMFKHFLNSVQEDIDELRIEATKEVQESNKIREKISLRG